MVECEVHENLGQYHNLRFSLELGKLVDVNRSSRSVAVESKKSPGLGNEDGKLLN